MYACPEFDLSSFSRTELKQFVSIIGEKPFRADQLWHWIYMRGAGQFKDMSNISKQSQKKWEQIARISAPESCNIQVSAKTGTIKYLWALEDGLNIESVYIPEKNRRTVCISTQAGCALGCKICATAKIGFERNLYAREITGQVLAVQKHIGEKLTNIVVMGMGEPFLNYNELMKSLYIIKDGDGIAIGSRKITISTAGIVPYIKRYTREGHLFQLAISLHATTDKQRSAIIPINKKYPLSMLLSAAEQYAKQSKQRVTFEYVLIDGFNDTPEDAERLIKMLKRIPCKVNLIALNPVKGDFNRPADHKINSFVKAIEPLRAPVTIRLSKGDDIDGACGQLAGKT